MALACPNDNMVLGNLKTRTRSNPQVYMTTFHYVELINCFHPHRDKWECCELRA